MIPSKFKSPSLFSILDRISVPFSPALSRSSLAYSTSSLDLQKEMDKKSISFFFPHVMISSTSSSLKVGIGFVTPEKCTVSGETLSTCSEPCCDEVSKHEWAGVFDLEEGSYEWTAQKVNGEYADPAMRMVVLKASGMPS